MIDNERRAVFLNGLRWANNILYELAGNTPLEAEQRRMMAAAMVALEDLAASMRAHPDAKRGATVVTKEQLTGPQLKAELAALLSQLPPADMVAFSAQPGEKAAMDRIIPRLRDSLIPGHILQIAQDNADLEAKALLAARKAIQSDTNSRLPGVAPTKAWRDVTKCSLAEARERVREHFGI